LPLDVFLGVLVLIWPLESPRPRPQVKIRKSQELKIATAECHPCSRHEKRWICNCYCWQHKNF